MVHSVVCFYKQQNIQLIRCGRCLPVHMSLGYSQFFLSSIVEEPEPRSRNQIASWSRSQYYKLRLRLLSNLSDLSFWKLLQFKIFNLISQVKKSDFSRDLLKLSWTGAGAGTGAAIRICGSAVLEWEPEPKEISSAPQHYLQWLEVYVLQDITALAADAYLVFTAAGKDIYAWRRGKYRTLFIIYRYPCKQGCRSGSVWNRIYLSCRLRIRVRNADPDPGVKIAIQTW